MRCLVHALGKATDDRERVSSAGSRELFRKRIAFAGGYAAAHNGHCGVVSGQPTSVDRKHSGGIGNLEEGLGVFYVI
jgi:hypothetical protein